MRLETDSVLSFVSKNDRFQNSGENISLQIKEVECLSIE